MSVCKNASSANSFVLTDNNETIKQSFGNSLAYYNSYSFDNLADMAKYYLDNDEEREKSPIRQDNNITKPYLAKPRNRYL